MSAETAVEPTYRDVSIDLLLSKLYAAYWNTDESAADKYLAATPGLVRMWRRVAEAAVDELIDRPEREFKQQLAAIVARNEERDSVGSWAPATAEGWM